MEFKRATLEDLETVARIEKESYPADEAASLEKKKFRHSVAPSLFYCGWQDGEIIGYINSTRCNFYDESTMEFNHEPEGKLVAIHSVCVAAGHRRKGIASTMMKKYLKLIRESETNVEKAVLITKVKNLNLYLGCGFRAAKKTDITHGVDPWVECEYPLNSRPFQVIDAFTSVPGCGNPAAVVSCLDVIDKDLGKLKPWMQKTAAEFNLSETAFVFKFDDEENYRVLYFTPVAQVIFCGHATVASAKMFLSMLNLDAVNLELEDKRVISIEKAEEKLNLMFPRVECVQYPENEEQEKTIKELLGVSEFVGISRAVDGNEEVVLVELSSQDFRNLYEKSIDFVTMKEKVRETLIVTTKSMDCGKFGDFDFGGYKDDWNFDFFSRMFAPCIGIDEDPVTGFAHTILFPYYLKKYPELKEKTALRAFQASKRGGIIEANPHKDASKLEITAEAVLVSSGDLHM